MLALVRIGAHCRVGLQTRSISTPSLSHRIMAVGRVNTPETMDSQYDLDGTQPTPALSTGGQ